MLEKVDLALSMAKDVYKERLSLVSSRLTLLHRASWAAGIPVIIVFEGWDASGKGTSVNLLAQSFDPRGFKIQATKGASVLERQMPWLWRFWLKTPNYGEIGIFDRSWYGRVLVERVEKLVPGKVWKLAYQDILDFERTLADDGYAIIKFFIHISKKEQKRRFKTLEKDPLQKWRVSPEDWEHHRKYDEYLVAYEEMLAKTETEYGPWVIVEGTDRYWARIKVLETVSRRIEEALLAHGKPLPPQLGSVEAQIKSAEEE
jgi:polyphosphate kinase 2 (PPK2 family)